MPELQFHSKINSTYTKALTKLFFFNKNQQSHYQKIIEAVEKFGEPIISNQGAYISLSIKGRPDSRSVILSYGPVLVGAIIYILEPLDTLQVVHIVIDPGVNKNSLVYQNIIISIYSYLKEISKRLHAKQIRILYSGKYKK